MVWMIMVIIAAILMVKRSFPMLYRSKLWKELIVFSVLILLGTVAGVAQSLQLPIPNPLDLITLIYQPMSRMILALLK
ncbi:hypothetical protein [Paenibacillus sp. FSL H8-0034]|uniref:hypothetical protein n=1 Tax=Paenibacillus sp. FSL H8-0034 TaxID=2954671 RepID=UPI0030F65F63